MGHTIIKPELRAMIEHHQPDALILTETKFVRDARLDHQLRQMLSYYQIHISSRPKQTSLAGTEPQECLRQGSAGILMAIHNRWQPQACNKRHFHDKKDFLTGHVIDVTLQPPHSPYTSAACTCLQI